MLLVTPAEAGVQKGTGTFEIKSICAKMFVVDSMENRFRSLPSVDRLMSEDMIKQLRDEYPHDLLVDLIRQHLEQDRVSIALGNPCPSIIHIKFLNEVLLIIFLVGV